MHVRIVQIDLNQVRTGLRQCLGNLNELFDCEPGNAGDHRLAPLPQFRNDLNIIVGTGVFQAALRSRIEKRRWRNRLRDNRTAFRTGLGEQLSSRGR